MENNKNLQDSANVNKSNQASEQTSQPAKSLPGVSASNATTKAQTFMIINTVLATLVVVLGLYIAFPYVSKALNIKNNNNNPAQQKQEQNDFNATQTPTKTTSTSTPTATKKPVKQNIPADYGAYTWLTYKDKKHPRITFKYPKGSSIQAYTTSDKSRYIVKVNYKNQLFIKSTLILGGIGGLPYATFAYNRIVYNKPFTNMIEGQEATYYGIYALTVYDGPNIGFDYRKFNYEHRIDVEALAITVTMPKNVYSPKYDKLLDKIGTSIWGINNPVYLSGVPYFSDDKLFGIKNFKPFVITQVPPSRKFYDFFLSLDTSYIAFVVQDKKTNNLYVNVFNAKNGALMKLSNQTMLGPIELGEINWYDNDKFVMWDAKANKYYNADIGAQTIKQISKQEFELYSAKQ